MIKDWVYGDNVRAIDIDGNFRAGHIANMEWGFTKEGDDVVKNCLIYDSKTKKYWSVKPETMEYVVDKNGFWFRGESNRGTVVVGRNDNLLFDREWMRETGAKLLMESMTPPKKRVRRARKKT